LNKFISIYKSSKEELYKVIFPITFYKDNTMFSRGVRIIEDYIEHGITGTVMEAESEDWNDARKDNISFLTRKGMNSMSISITNYLINKEYEVGGNRFEEFKKIIKNLKNNPRAWRGILTLGIDNEFYHRNSQFKKSIQEIKKIIKDKPIQMLNGREGISSWYNDYVDITGTYIADDHKAIDGKEATTQIHQLETQRLDTRIKIPVSLLQINSGTKENFGSILMAGIGIGGTKLEYWKDSLSNEFFNRNLDVTKKPIWKQLQKIRKYIDKMCDLGIIESSPYLGFRIQQTNDTYEYIKGRLGKNNKIYIIVTNMTPMNKERDVNFNQGYENLHYVPSGILKDIITGEVKGKIDSINKKIKINLKPHEWVVLEVESK